jgi:hypothetical protein
MSCRIWANTSNLVYLLTICQEKQRKIAIFEGSPQITVLSFSLFSFHELPLRSYSSWNTEKYHAFTWGWSVQTKSRGLRHTKCRWFSQLEKVERQSFLIKPLLTYQHSVVEAQCKRMKTDGRTDGQTQTYNLTRIILVLRTIGLGKKLQRSLILNLCLGKRNLLPWNSTYTATYIHWWAFIQ